jgi:hypothetical protein
VLSRRRVGPRNGNIRIHKKIQTFIIAISITLILVQLKKAALQHNKAHDWLSFADV